MPSLIDEPGFRLLLMSVQFTPKELAGLRRDQIEGIEEAIRYYESDPKAIGREVLKLGKLRMHATREKLSLN